jgi:hypothetical protein
MGTFSPGTKGAPSPGLAGGPFSPGWFSFIFPVFLSIYVVLYSTAIRSKYEIHIYTHTHACMLFYTLGVGTPNKLLNKFSVIRQLGSIISGQIVQ